MDAEAKSRQLFHQALHDVHNTCNMGAFGMRGAGLMLGLRQLAWRGRLLLCLPILAVPLGQGPGGTGSTMCADMSTNNPLQGPEDTPIDHGEAGEGVAAWLWGWLS